MNWVTLALALSCLVFVGALVYAISGSRPRISMPIVPEGRAGYRSFSAFEAACRRVDDELHDRISAGHAATILNHIVAGQAPTSPPTPSPKDG